MIIDFTVINKVTDIMNITVIMGITDIKDFTKNHRYDGHYLRPLRKSQT